MPLPMKLILMPVYGTYLRIRYRIKLEGKELLKDFKGPAIVFANHTHTLDPFLISCMMPFHIRWVAGAYLFRMPFVSFLMRKMVTAIPKTQGRSDLETIRSISKALKENDIIGLFPEGTRTWNGDTLDIVGGTAKLVRLFKVPVVFINIQTGFAKKPRWANKERKGRINLKVMKVLTPEEIASMSLPQISDCVSSNLMFSFDKWIEDKPQIIFKGPVAEGIERVLYACPKCKKISTMVSDDKSVKCSFCGAKAEVDGHYSLSSETISFKRIAAWQEWERELLADVYEKANEDTLIFPEDDGILFQKLVGKDLEDLANEYKLKCYKDRFEFSFSKEVEGSKSKIFNFTEIESLVVNTKQTIEIFCNGQQYRFRPAGMISSLKYQDLYNEFLKYKEEKKA